MDEQVAKKLIKEISIQFGNLGRVSESTSQQLLDLQLAIDIPWTPIASKERANVPRLPKEADLPRLYQTLIGEELSLFELLYKDATTNDGDALAMLEIVQALYAADREAALQKQTVHMQFGALDTRSALRSLFRSLFMKHWPVWDYAKSESVEKRHSSQIRRHLENIDKVLTDSLWLTQVFVCYSALDRIAVDDLVDLVKASLVDTHITFWQDTNGVGWGEPYWQGSIQPTLDETDACMVFLSSNFFEKAPTVNSRELPYILDRSSKPTGMLLLPVVLSTDWLTAKSSWIEQIRERDYVPRASDYADLDYEDVDFKVLRAAGHHARLVTKIRERLAQTMAKLVQSDRILQL